MNRPEMLNAYAEKAKARKFRPGSHDCALFAAGWVKLATGSDPAKGWRGQYRSLRRGQALLEEAGLEDHVALAASLLPEVAPAFAQIGDIALVDGLALGVVNGERIWVLQKSGIATVPLNRATRVFRVGSK